MKKEKTEGAGIKRKESGERSGPRRVFWGAGRGGELNWERESLSGGVCGHSFQVLAACYQNLVSCSDWRDR